MRIFRVSGLLVSAASVLSGGAALAQLPGDLDGNQEVSLSDVSGFVGCVSGPDMPSLDPLCNAARFDDDDDVDLRDVAAFQNRFGFGIGPPQIDRFWPTPGEWIVDDVGLTEVRIGFTEPVVIPDGAVDVWVVSGLPGGGTVDGFTTSYDEETYLLTVLFAEALRDDRVTVVIDYAIEDVAGNPLDGEITDPLNAALPSGNGINGGQGVFRIHVLQGDANRDGIVDAADQAIVTSSLGLCAGDPGFDANADLNADGCVDTADANIVSAAVGRQLPATDGEPLTVVRIINFLWGPDYSVIGVSFSETIAFTSFNTRSCYLVDESGSVVLPYVASPNSFGTGAEYFFHPPIGDCSSYTVNVSNALADLSGELLVLPPPCTCLEDCPPFDETP